MTTKLDLPGLRQLSALRQFRNRWKCELTGDELRQWGEALNAHSRELEGALAVLQLAPSWAIRHRLHDAVEDALTSYEDDVALYVQAVRRSREAVQ